MSERYVKRRKYYRAPKGYSRSAAQRRGVFFFFCFVRDKFVYEDNELLDLVMTDLEVFMEDTRVQVMRESFSTLTSLMRLLLLE